MIGKNQIDFGELSSAERDSIPYDTFIKSLLYVTSTAFAETDSDPFSYGNKKFTAWLVIFFYISIVCLLVHMLNMLIAMMGEIYNSRSKLADLVRVRDHLRFVVDNWYLSNAAYKDEKSRIKYIVSAFLDKDDS